MNHEAFMHSSAIIQGAPQSIQCYWLLQQLEVAGDLIDNVLLT
jgi:hypothetical protein